MKRVLMVFLCVSLLILSSAAVELDYYAYATENGEIAYDYDHYYADLAAEMVAEAGLSLDTLSYWITDDTGTPYYDYASFEIDYYAALAALEESQKEESQGEEMIQDEILEPPVSEGEDDPGSGDDSAADELSNADDPAVLEPPPVTEDESAASDSDPVSEPVTEDPVSGEVLDDPGETVVGDEGSEPHTYQVLYANSDPVITSDDPAVVSGLKSVIVSIFGEYEPVMTTGTVTETVDNVTTTTLYDTVADGAAGVDYEWIAGVFLFGILLFCLMRLLGGILK